MTRLTISLDDDLYAMARAHAIASKTSISKAIAHLLRRRAEGPLRGEGGSGSVPSLHPLSGFPVSESAGRPFTSDDVRLAEDDEDARHLDLMGLTPGQARETLRR